MTAPPTSSATATMMTSGIERLRLLADSVPIAFAELAGDVNIRGATPQQPRGQHRGAAKDNGDGHGP